ncbi:MAG: potassium-transporting ATPase subunit KdpC [Chlamydiales bacterium]|nr:potassium-transporting ATPase subunit KdpC [Chlamydiales bacterium]
MKFLKDLITAIKLTVCFMVVLCGIYPLIVFGLGRVFFSHKADGSLVFNKSNAPIGSELIGQNFHSPKYFHPRPSAAGKNGYDASNSSGSNLGPTSKKLITNIRSYASAYRKENKLNQKQNVPIDAVTASASGLDPHISVQNAILQLHRIAKARQLPEETIKKLIEECTQNKMLGFLGEERINVLLINQKLDTLKNNRKQ